MEMKMKKQTHDKRTVVTDDAVSSTTSLSAKQRADKMLPQFSKPHIFCLFVCMKILSEMFVLTHTKATHISITNTHIEWHKLQCKFLHLLFSIMCPAEYIIRWIPNEATSKDFAMS